MRALSTSYSIVYQRLLKAYGPQGWWPVADPGHSSPTYRKRAQLTEQQKIEVMFGAILTQNTSWKNVEKAMIHFHSKRLIDGQKILAMPHNRLASLIRSSGYHNQKAIKLKHLAQFLGQHPLNELEQMKEEKLRTLLLAVHGIGPETADSIILYAFQKPGFVIDTYTKRIFSRIGVCKEDVEYDALRNVFMDNLKKDTMLFNEYHALLVEHAKQHCRKTPMCDGCPIREQCRYGKKNRGEK